MMLGDCWRHYPKLQEILSQSSGSVKWLQLAMITKKTSRDHKLVMSRHNGAYVHHLTKLNQKLKTNKWYSSGDIDEAKQLIDNIYPQLEVVIDYKCVGQK